MRFGWLFALALPLLGCSFPEYALQELQPVVTCGDGLQNGSETSADCGADCASGCASVPECTANQDCASNLCVAGSCTEPQTEPHSQTEPQPQATPSCSNKLRDQSESDVDCGGRDGCAPCATGQRCETTYDCSMAKCNAGFCLAQSCSDGIQNQDETDTDCGGESCGPCATLQHCNETTDCDHARCSQGLCQPEGCDDGVKNGDETGKDCGGSCAPCPDFAGCEGNVDCKSLSCNSVAQFCLAATCQDGIKNGVEAAIDCGSGNGCSKCGMGSACTANADCQSGACSEQRCVPAAATGAALPTSGWIATASATFSASTQPEEALDGDAGSHWTGGASQVPGMWFQIDMLQARPFFGLDIVCTSNGDYPHTLRVLSSEDGKTFTTLTGSTGGQPTLHFGYGSARFARYIKLELLQDSSIWWRIDELRVTN